MDHDMSTQHTVELNGSYFNPVPGSVVVGMHAAKLLRKHVVKQWVSSMFPDIYIPYPAKSKGSSSHLPQDRLWWLCMLSHQIESKG